MAQDGLAGGLPVDALPEQADGTLDSEQTTQVIIRPPDVQAIQFQTDQGASLSNGEEEKKKEDDDAAGGQASVKLVPGVVSVSMPGMPGTNLVTFPSNAGDISGITMVAFPHGAGMAGAQMQLPTIMAPGQQGLFQTQSVQAQGLSGNLSGAEVGSEDAGRKRELRLLKNREAAKECRRKKKEYVRCLENRVAVLEAQNKTLIDELKQLKDLYCTKAD